VNYEVDEVAVVVVAPTITELLPESGWTKVAEGDGLELTCRATGRPQPVINWTHRRHHFDTDVTILFSVAFLSAFLAVWPHRPLGVKANTGQMVLNFYCVSKYCDFTSSLERFRHARQLPKLDWTLRWCHDPNLLIVQLSHADNHHHHHHHHHQYF